jgi:hypothetical protein
MARVQVESGVRAEALQTVAMPKAQAVTPRFDPNSSQAFQLAAALGAAQPLADRIKERALDAEEEDARRFASSMTAEELRKKIDNKELPAWRSPLWVATVQNVAGDNTAKSIFRDVDSKIANNEFNTQQDVDNYIKQRRDEALGGKSNYQVAGFDKNFNSLRDRALNQQNAVQTKRLESQGLEVATEDLSNAASEITGEAFNGKTNQDRVAYVLQKYNMHRTARTLNDSTAKAALDGVILSLAAAGQKELVDEFIKTKLPNNGPTVEAFLSPARVLQLRNTAEREWNQAQNETARRVLQAEIDTIVTAANSQADELVSQQNGSAMPDITIPNGSGGTRTVKGVELVEAAIGRQIAAKPDMPFDQQVRLYKNNGIINQAWKKDFSTAVYNLGEITIDAQGKPSGKLLQPTIDSLERFSIARQVSEQYAKDLVGEDNYKILNKIQALREAGIPDVNMAAGVVNQINRRQYEPVTWGNIKKDVGTAIEDIKNPGIFTGRFWGELFRGEFGSASKNIIPIQGNIQELAEAYVQARIAPDGKSAVKMATEYMSKSVVQVNNTLYMRSDLPKVPKGEDEIDWFERYQTEVLIPQLKKMGIDPSVSDLTLLPQKGGQPSYVIANLAMPIPGVNGGAMVVTQAEIEKWIEGSINTRNQGAADDANTDLKRKQIREERRKNRVSADRKTILGF